MSVLWLILRMVLGLVCGLFTLLILLLCPQTGCVLHAENGGVRVSVRYGLMRKRVFQLPVSAQKKAKKSSKPKKSAKDKLKDKPQDADKPKVKRDLQAILQLVFDLLHVLHNALRIDVLDIKARFATDDAAQTGILLGNANALAGAVTPFLRQFYTIGRYHIAFDADFEPKKTTFDPDKTTQYQVDCAFSIRPIRLVCAVLWRWRKIYPIVQNERGARAK